MCEVQEFPFDVSKYQLYREIFTFFFSLSVGLTACYFTHWKSGDFVLNFFCEVLKLLRKIFCEVLRSFCKVLFQFSVILCVSHNSVTSRSCKLNSKFSLECYVICKRNQKIQEDLYQSDFQSCQECVWSFA